MRSLVCDSAWGRPDRSWAGCDRGEAEKRVWMESRNASPTLVWLGDGCQHASLLIYRCSEQGAMDGGCQWGPPSETSSPKHACSTMQRHQGYARQNQDRKPATPWMPTPRWGQNLAGPPHEGVHDRLLPSRSLIHRSGQVWTERSLPAKTIMKSWGWWSTLLNS